MIKTSAEYKLAASIAYNGMSKYAKSIKGQIAGAGLGGILGLSAAVPKAHELAIFDLLKRKAIDSGELLADRPKFTDVVDNINSHTEWAKKQLMNKLLSSTGYQSKIDELSQAAKSLAYNDNIFGLTGRTDSIIDTHAFDNMLSSPAAAALLGGGVVGGGLLGKAIGNKVGPKSRNYFLH